MSRGDWWSVAVTLVLAGGTYFVGEKLIAALALILGTAIGLYLHFKEKGRGVGDFYDLRVSKKTNKDGSVDAEAKVSRIIDRR